MPQRLFAAMPALLLAACASAPPPAASLPSTTEMGQCNAHAATTWLGQPASAEIVEAIRIATGSKTVRSLKPNDAMTMDYRLDRVNVLQDADGKIEKINCG